jgi:hypothetical protein
VPDALSRDGSDKQRTRGGVLSRGGLLLRLLDDEEAQPANATNNSDNATAPRGFMRPFYRGIGYI